MKPEWVSRTGRWIISSLVIAVLTSTAGVGAMAQPATIDLSQVKTIAVAPFADEAGMREDLARWAALRLTQLLARDRLQVVPLDQIERTLQEMRLRPSDLISPTATADLGRRVAADAVITGRLLRADRERRLDTSSNERVPPEAFVTLELRVMIVASRRLFYTEVAGYGIILSGLTSATEMALQEFIRQLKR